MLSTPAPAQKAGRGKNKLGLEKARVEAISGMLVAAPAPMLPPISDRAAWQQIGQDAGFAGAVARAEGIVGKPIPPLPDELYLEFSRNGNRSRYQDVAFGRRGRLDPLVIAECIENKGRFLPEIEKLIAEYCRERTWVLPAHDKKLTNFEGTEVTIDLFSSALGWRLALTDQLLGERVSPQTRTALRAALAKFIVDPFRDMLDGKRSLDRWFRMTNNWNPVCFAGVLGTVFHQETDADFRARAIAAAEKYSDFFIKGFTTDGYCSEGLGYWNYGYGHYAMLTELVRHQTASKLDLMTLPGVQMPALFGARIQVINGIAPSFADCALGVNPTSHLMWLINHRFSLDLPQWSQLDRSSISTDLIVLSVYYNALMKGLPKLEAPIQPKTEKLRSWFSEAGVLICRPTNPTGMGVALKGGNNAEQHNHNDLGSYVVVSGKATPLLDPGTEAYTARTFSAQRYDSNVLNSYGHPVPKVAGKLQQAGEKAVARLLSSDLTEQTDTVRFDLTSAYDEPALVSLHRTFIYSRAGNGSLTVKDEVTFREPKEFETALITAGTAQGRTAGQFSVTHGGETLNVVVDAGGQQHVLTQDKIKDGMQPTRIGIRMAQPVTAATITTVITPTR